MFILLYHFGEYRKVVVLKPNIMIKLGKSSHYASIIRGRILTLANNGTSSSRTLISDRLNGHFIDVALLLSFFELYADESDLYKLNVL